MTLCRLRTCLRILTELSSHSTPFKSDSALRKVSPRGSLVTFHSEATSNVLSCKASHRDSATEAGSDTGHGSGADPPHVEPLDSLLKPSSSVPEDPDWATMVYPKGSRERRSQARRSVRPGVDPRATSVFLFPGQGAQRVGMVDHLLPYPNVVDMFDEASKILGYDLLDLCRNGPAKELDRTDKAQPAILVTSLAAVEKLRDEQTRAVESCMAAAGFSVGELAALTFAGAIRFNAAVKLAKIRGEAMQLASDLAPSGMMTVVTRPEAKLGFACLLAKQWCEETGIENPVCNVANFLFPQCKVLAGNVEALQFIADRASEFGLRRCTRLRVAGAFHSALMEPAVEPFKEALKNVQLSMPDVPVYSNVTAARYKNVADMRKQLTKQLTRPVKWEQTMHVLYERSADVPFPRTFECGPGTTLKAVLAKVNARAADVCESVDQMKSG